MLIVETIGRIRREHFVQGKTIREIARDLKLSRALSALKLARQLGIWFHRTHGKKPEFNPSTKS